MNAPSSWARRCTECRRSETILAYLDAYGEVHETTDPAQHSHANCIHSAATEPPPELWRDLCEGRATVAECGVNSARHYVLFANAARESHKLTALETETLQRAGHGATNKCIAFALGVTPSAVSAALRRASEKLGISSRTSLVQLAARLSPDPAPRVDVERLTSAEREVLVLVRRGFSNRAIAKARSRSLRTVANQVASILGKTKSPSRRSLAALA